VKNDFLLEMYIKKITYAPVEQRLWRVSESTGQWRRAQGRALCFDLALHLAAMDNRDVISSHVQKWSISMPQLREEHSS